MAIALNVDVTQPPDVNPASDRDPADHLAEPVRRPEHQESSFTRVVEQQTAKISSEVFLALGLGAMATSVIAELSGRQRLSRFTGMWVAPILIMGLYNKLVKSIGAS